MLVGTTISKITRSVVAESSANTDGRQGLLNRRDSCHSGGRRLPWAARAGSPQRRIRSGCSGGSGGSGVGGLLIERGKGRGMKSELLADALASPVPLSCFPQPVSLNCKEISHDQCSKEVRYHPELQKLVDAGCAASTLVRKRNVRQQ